MKKLLNILLTIVVLLVGVYALTGCVGNESKKDANETINSLESSNSENQNTPSKEENVVANSTTTNTTDTTNKIENVAVNTTSSNTESKQENDGYEINVSSKEITVKKGSSSSFVVTFTNPDESSVREYLKCKDQSDIVIMKYTPVENKKTTVEVEGLKVGSTEIEVCDYNYPDIKQIIKVNVTE